MKEIIPIGSAYTKVEMNKEDYDKLVELAEMNAEQIEQKAFELWRTKGASKMIVNCTFKSLNHEYEDCYPTTQFEFDPWSISTGGEYDYPGKFEISPKMQSKIRKAAKNIAKDAFFHTYGQHLMEIDKIRRINYDLKQKRLRFKYLTILGWTLFAITFIATLIFN